jgi:hypothetical protein
MAASPFLAAILRDAAPRGVAPQDEVQQRERPRNSYLVKYLAAVLLDTRLHFRMPPSGKVEKIDFRLTIVFRIAIVSGWIALR